jgi:hypothetical protein
MIIKVDLHLVGRAKKREDGCIKMWVTALKSPDSSFDIE